MNAPSEFDQFVMDGNQKLISVGTRLSIMVPDKIGTWKARYVTATVYEITDVDSDYDDDTQRAVMYPPKVKYRFDDGEVDEASTSYIPVMTNPVQMWFVCEDVEVIENA